jgi:prepilin-type N-terminal cleavage/methylation domain-containing protein
MRIPPARGMTLIELMAVVAILAILTALSATAVGPMVVRYRQLVAAEGALQLVSQARVEARQQGRCYRVQVTAAGVPQVPGFPGDALHVVRRDSADCQTAAPPLVPDARFADVRMPQGIQVLVPVGSWEPEFRPNGYTQNGLDTEMDLGPVGWPGPTTRIAIRSYGPICYGPYNPVQPCP